MFAPRARGKNYFQQKVKRCLKKKLKYKSFQSPTYVKRDWVVDQMEIASFLTQVRSALSTAGRIHPTQIQLGGGMLFFPQPVRKPPSEVRFPAISVQEMKGLFPADSPDLPEARAHTAFPASQAAARPGRPHAS